jgi:hypothetical protein
VTECTQYYLGFQSLKRRKVEAEFSGGDITSDGGVLLLREMDRRLGLLASVDRVLQDGRDSSKVVHSQLSLLQQRVYGLCLGYEDLNDHQTLRHDPAIQTAVNRLSPLASQSTLCRLENRADKKALFAVHEVMLQQFIASFRRAPRKLVLDFDATDDRVHGMQEGRFFHGYYDHHCFLPLYVFCGEQLLVNYLRPSNIDGAKHAWAILALLVKRLRQAWPKVRIIFRGDSGFCRHRLLDWCDRNKVGYIVGLAKNSRLEQQLAIEIKAAAEVSETLGAKVRFFENIRYGAASWKSKRRVIAKIEHTLKGSNPRFIVTNLRGGSQRLYDNLYCARGEMENRIKEQQLGLFADRTSAHAWWANQFRLLLSGLAYMLLEAIRRTALKGTKLARAQATTIRLRLLKIGAVILRNTRRIRFLLSSSYPDKALFVQVASRLRPT